MMENEMLRPSIEVAKIFFKEKALPRRTRDQVAEQKFLSKHDRPRCFYRRVGLDEDDRGELYPIWTAGLKTFAHFGIGIGIYFTQLLFLAAVSFLGAFIMIVAAQAYRNTDYNANQSTGFLRITAACDSYRNITVSQGCGVGEDSCIALYANKCDLPYNAAVADLTMSCFFAFAVFSSVLFENKIIEDLDESVQTAQDYSVEVKDPPFDADNPDEWQAHFSRFGIVRYVTILRKNSSLLDMVRKKHKYVQKIVGLQRSNPHSSRIKYYQSKLDVYNKALDEKCRGSYPVSRVYITFEYEEHQRLCLRDNEVPDIQAMLDIRDRSQTKRYFRNSEVLDVVEPPEPDNIIWKNIEVPLWRRIFKRFISIFVSFGILVLVWYIVQYTKSVSPTVLAVVIGFIDSLLPTIFEGLTMMTIPLSEGWKQSTLQVRLFGARLLLSTVLPYIQTQWNQVLDPTFIQQIVLIQLAACFIAPIIAFFDLAGVVRKNILAPMQETQEEMNLKFTGSEWLIAEKYTGIAKILFVSLYYSLLIPYSLFICVPAFIMIFCIDRYLLLRKWRQIPMIDEKVAVRLRQQAILAVAAHMYVSMRFIYSWPMDNVYRHDDGTFEKVEKYPRFGVWGLNLQDWQSAGQKRIFYSYKICLFLITATAAIVWIFIPAYRFFNRLFCKTYREVGDSQGIPFSSLSRVEIYEPFIQTEARNYLCAHTMGVIPRHRPSVLVAGPADPLELSHYIPPQHRMFVLSVVKYYPGDSAMPVKSDQENVLHRMGDLHRSINDTTDTLSINIDDDRRQYDEQKESRLNLRDDRNMAAENATNVPEELLKKIRGKKVTREEMRSNNNANTLNNPTLREAQQGVRSSADRAASAQARVRSLRMQAASRMGRDSRVMPSVSPMQKKRDYRYTRQSEDDDMEMV